MAPISSLSDSGDFKAASGQTFYVDLDAPGGAYSEWRHDDVAGMCALRAVVEIPQLRSDPRWLPQFSFWLRESADGGNSLSLRFWAKDWKVPIRVQIVQRNGATSTVLRNLDTSIDLNQKIPVEISWHSKEPVIIKIRHETFSVALKWPVRHVQINASTGEMILSPLVFGCNQK